jgi:two-component system sensor histidine kinase KdpD
MPTESHRKSPEELLRQVQAEELRATAGHLKVFLGYVSGVGKSFRMFDEARRRRERGQDIVVGAVQRAVPDEVATLLANLEVIPTKGIAIDVDALIRRHPTVCVIDGLAYDNPPGTRNRTRWQDVQELMQAGIKVIGSINIQYVAELREQVETITGKHVTETVPVAFLESADEIEIVDAPAGGKGDEQRLSKLRELALVLAADVVDHQLNTYLEAHGIQQHPGAQERLMVCITPRANIADMLKNARTIAERFHAELIVAYVHQPEISPEDQAALDEKLALARAAGARIETLDGVSPVDAILDFAHSRCITQLFIGHSQRRGLAARIWGTPVDELIRRSRGMDLRIFPQ